MSWFAYALLAGLASALNVAVSKRLVSHTLSPVLIGGVVHLWGGLLCLALLPLGQARADWSLEVLLGLAAMGMVYTLGNALYFLALKRTQLSEIDLFLRTSSLWTFLGGVLLLGEPSGPRAVLGAACIALSVAVVSRQRELRLAAAQVLALAAALTFGAGNLLDKLLSGSFDPLSYTALNLLLTGVGMLAWSRARLSALLQPVFWRPGAWLVALTFALTQLFIILAFAAGGSAGQVILVAQVRLLLLLLTGVLLWRERDRLGHKLAASFLMVTGLLALYAGRG